MRRRAALIALVSLAIIGGAALTTQPASATDPPDGHPYCVGGSPRDPDGHDWRRGNEESCVVSGKAVDRGATNSGNATTSGSSASRGGSGGPDIAAVACPNGTSCGSYPVNGLGARKQAIRNAGADVLDLAIAMLETENMQANYPYGDNKTGDAADFGVFKQNWYMIRSSCGRFNGLGANDYPSGAALNSDLNADVSCLNESQGYYGIDRWFGGNRTGEAGLSSPSTGDINTYKTAVYWIRDQLNSNPANLTNDIRFWVNIPAP